MLALEEASKYAMVPSSYITASTPKQWGTAWDDLRRHPPKLEPSFRMGSIARLKSFDDTTLQEAFVRIDEQLRRDTFLKDQCLYVDVSEDGSRTTSPQTVADIKARCENVLEIAQAVTHTLSLVRDMPVEQSSARLDEAKKKYERERREISPDDHAETLEP
jgi:AbiV family abortive infection protein